MVSLFDKKQVVFLLLVFLFFGTFTTVSAQEKIDSFHSDISIQKDSSIIVEERITYSFDENKENHGIFRYIPYKNYTESGERVIDIEVLSVKKNNSPEPYNVSNRNNNINIKIGSPDVFVSGTQEYSIRYKVENVILYSDNIDELFWNITGNEWDVPINNTTAYIHLPESIEKDKLQATCYKGHENSTASCPINYLSSENKTKTITTSVNNLGPREGVTVAVGFPKNIVDTPEISYYIMSWFRNNWPWLIPISTLIIMSLLWFRRGRDPRIGTIMPRYSPPESFTPILVGAAMDTKVHDRDITAGLIYLAQKGIVSIKRIEKTQLKVFNSVDYKITLKQDLSTLKEDEKGIINIFFNEYAKKGDDLLVSEIKGNVNINKRIKELKDSIHKEMIEIGLFVKSPRKIKNFYLSIGMVLFFISFNPFSLFFPFINKPIEASFGFLISAIIVIIFSFIMPRYTKKGIKTKAHILGFKDFLSMTEKDRYAFHNAPEKSPQEFMENLPYAIALGVEKKWAKQFEGMYIESPSWYSGQSQAQRIAISSFLFDISSFSDFTGSTVRSVSQSNTASRGIMGSGSSGGGGFSGGGFGGGGGGSW